MPKELDKQTMEKMRRIASIFDPNTLTTEQFKSNFKKVLDFTVKFKKHILSEFSSIKQSISELSSKLENDNTTSISSLKDEIRKIVSKALKEQEGGMNFMKDKVSRLTNGKDGKDANIKKIVKKVLKQIKLPEQKEMLLDTPDTIANKLETLSGEGKLKIEAVLDLEKRLKELEERPIGRGGVMGGGVGKLAFEAKFVDWTLLGTGDGTTTEFTLPVTPNPTTSLQLKVGGGELFVTEDWTLSGRVVTFLTAPPNTAKIRYKCRK